ncbi:YceI-like domain-containing protein [Leeuwenhoekiella aestuarii]|uniref:YceI-like domain-containing protein n=1 Tax=Leeuwenhoekiella aestuarii TaxID=2249426 RepID=A0A4Q0NWH7_9FLAO|nr:YceI family protein [Leeuwenhoekiella aestuarii]RXG11669.1 YceI-like domain-containing protein [Leeuwenhoekiella aestuarii]RXG15120.1 YceI-like domain-containing protein [Leeuwenhoekiella aestuarii]
MNTYLNKIVLILMLINVPFLNAQETFTIEKTRQIDMRLNGSSTLHDWEMDAKKSNGEARFTFDTNDGNTLKSLDALTFNLEVLNLKSDSKGLDKNAYKALKSDTYKEIHYILSSSQIAPEKGGYLLQTKGKLTVAGVTKDIVMNLHLVVHSPNAISCKGEYQLNMTDYNVEPPSFMMGLMKTDEDLTLGFDVIYSKPEKI